LIDGGDPSSSTVLCTDVGRDVSCVPRCDVRGRIKKDGGFTCVAVCSVSTWVHIGLRGWHAGQGQSPPGQSRQAVVMHIAWVQWGIWAITWLLERDGALATHAVPTSGQHDWGLLRRWILEQFHAHHAFGPLGSVPTDGSHGCNADVLVSSELGAWNLELGTWKRTTSYRKACEHIQTKHSNNCLRVDS
jgi:hypothetical protein